MKKIYNTLFSLGIVAMIFSSCSDWLDVRPSDEIKEECLKRVAKLTEKVTMYSNIKYI